MTMAPQACVRCYVELAKGDKEGNERHKQEYQRFCDFVVAKGAAYGLGQNPDALSEEQTDALLGLYAADPDWRAKGSAQATKPKCLVLGRLTFRLFEDCPRTVENFRALCTGEKGVSKVAPYKPLHYKGGHMHRLVKGFVLQGGDVGRDDGSGKLSIYGGAFKDEKSGLLKHSFAGRGYLGMANSGKDSNTSQFFITICSDASRLAKLNRKHVCFGVVEDETDPVITKVLDALEGLELKSAKDESPAEKIWIHDCGQIL